MTTKKSKGSSGVEILERAAGGPLTFGRALAAMRSLSGRSQVELAEILGITKGNLCDIEKGRRTVSVERAAEFAEKLSLPVKYWVKLALQDQINAAKLDLKVDVTAA